MANNRKATGKLRARQDGCRPEDGVQDWRTYRTQDLLEIMPGETEELLRDLKDFFGLVPLGRQTHLFYGKNVIESLIRHARNERIDPLPKAPTRDDLRKDRRARNRRQK